jgi:hypothetical protein
MIIERIVIVGLSIALGFVLAQTRKLSDATELRLRNAKTGGEIILDVAGAGPSIVLRAKGRPSIRIGMEGKQGGLAISDERGKTRISIASGPAGPAVILGDSSGAKRIVIGGYYDKPGIVVLDSKGKPTWKTVKP